MSTPSRPPSSPRVQPAATTPPKTAITPDSFGVAPQLLGLPLAGPGRRAAAMVIDLVAVAFLVRAGAVFFGILAAAALWRASGGGAKSGLVRTSVRTTLRLGAAVVIFIVVLSGIGAIRDGFGDANDEISARDDTGDDDDVIVPPMDDVPGIAVAGNLVGAPDSAPSPADTRSAALEANNDELRSENDELRDEINELRGENDALRERIERFGFTDRIRSIATEDLGLGFGWMALYFTALVALFRGQTLGKWMLGIRVIRLDGRPMSWWIAFERFGGYAASLFTGMLGFVQILWDRNRQGLHDKVVETVVIRTLPGVDHTGTRDATSARVGGVRRV